MYDRYIPDSKTKMSFKNKFKISLFIKKNHNWEYF